MLKIELVNPFVEGAMVFFRQEMGIEISRGRPRMESGSATREDVTVLIGVTGAIDGIVLYSMDLHTAKAIAAKMLQSPVPLYDSLAQSALSEMGNIITGRATIKLEALGYAFRLSPPVLITGGGTLISTMDKPMLVVPLILDTLGSLSIYICLSDKGS